MKRIRVPIYLLNYVSIVHRFCNITRYWSKISPTSTYPTSIWRLRWDEPIRISQDLRHQKTLIQNTVRHCFRDPTLSHFGRKLTCGGQTDGQTQGHSMYRASIESRGKNVAGGGHSTRSAVVMEAMSAIKWWRLRQQLPTTAEDSSSVDVNQFGADTRSSINANFCHRQLLGLRPLRRVERIALFRLSSLHCLFFVQLAVETPALRGAKLRVDTRNASIPSCTRRPASADRTARRQFQATGQPVSRTQASHAMTSRLPSYKAKCVQRNGPFAFKYQGNGATPANILIPL